jgi:hypothetical protein
VAAQLITKYIVTIISAFPRMSTLGRVQIIQNKILSSASMEGVVGREERHDGPNAD